MHPAHAFGVRYDLPIPLGLFVLGGGLVVLLSFAFVAPRPVERAASTPVADRPGLREPARAGAVISLAALGFLCFCGLSGSQEVPENILPTVFWLLVWIAVPLSCGLLGDWTQSVNPFAAMSRMTDSDALRQRLLGRKEALAWPGWLGWWPAVVLYFGAACGELIVNVTATVPHVLATGLLVYLVVCAVLGVLFGGAWRMQGELFTVLFSTWGRLGWFRFGASGRRAPGGGLAAGFEATASRVAFVLLLLTSVNLDGLLTTPQWASLERGLPGRIGLDPGRLEVFRTLVFVALALLLFSFFAGFALLAVRVVGGRAVPAHTALAALVPSLLPIAFGYLLVHNLQYLLINAQLMLPLIGNPTGQDSWPISLPFPFNDDFEPHTHFLPSAFYWYVGVAVIVVVHVAAVVVAHGRAVAPVARRRGRRAEYPWLAAMVAYTMISLWLIAQPFTEAKPPPAPPATTQTTQG